jgi:DUF971 family protein
MDKWPVELRLSKDRRTLSITFDDRSGHLLPAEYLRVMSPSAEVQGHSAAERRTVGGKRAVEILDLVPVGNYAVRIVFDDMHDTGLYGWLYLDELGREYATRWSAYLQALSDKGLSRDAPVRTPTRP